MNEKLQKALAYYYTETVIHGKPNHFAKTLLAELIDSDEEAKNAAVAKHQELKALNELCGNKLEQRCIISATQLKALKGVLNATV